jgi:hypothetical protein
MRGTDVLQVAVELIPGREAGVDGANTERVLRDGRALEGVLRVCRGSDGDQEGARRDDEDEGLHVVSLSIVDRRIAIDGARRIGAG